MWEPWHHHALRADGRVLRRRNVQHLANMTLPDGTAAPGAQVSNYRSNQTLDEYLKAQVCFIYCHCLAPPADDKHATVCYPCLA